MEQLFTPKQVGLALGVSESSIKRWCDNGRIATIKTAGGHRKITMPAVMQLVRESGQAFAKPDVLGLATVTTRCSPAESCDQLYQMLIDGDEAACRELLFSFFQQGESVQQLGDELVSPVFHRIGDNWESETIRIHHERRASEIILAVLLELRGWITAPPLDAPLALCAATESDFAQVPIRLVELVLRSQGWNTIVAGSGLPLVEIAAAVQERQARLICLSLTHIEDADAYVDLHNATFTDYLLSDRQLIVGGCAICEPHRSQIKCDLYAGSLGELVEFAAKLEVGEQVEK